MRRRYVGLMVALVAAACVAASTGVAGQTSASAQTPRWDPPRTSFGQPDIQGSWSQRSDITTYSIQNGERDRAEHVSIGGQAPQRGRPIVDPPDGLIPYQPWAAEKAELHRANHLRPPTPADLDPVSRCFQEGVPRIVYQQGMRIVQTPTYVAFLHDYGHHYRVVYLDGRPPLRDTLKLWMGDSRGRWEGNTLVVDVTNHNDRTWFDIVGSFHSDAMRIVERWTFADRDRIQYVATIEDPTVYTRPWKLAVTLGRDKQEEQWEHAVCEGNKTVKVAFNLPW